jgi:hypothetical protein
MTIRNGFVWLEVTDKAKEVFASGLFDVYKLHDDGSESLCQSYADINDALEWGLELAIEVGRLFSENHTLDIAIRINEMLIEKGLVKDCTDTDDESELEMQDNIQEILDKSLSN